MGDVALVQGAGVLESGPTLGSTARESTGNQAELAAQGQGGAGVRGRRQELSGERLRPQVESRDARVLSHGLLAGNGEWSTLGFKGPQNVWAHISVGGGLGRQHGS